MLSLGLLESAVLAAKRPGPWSAELAVSMLWSPFLMGLLGSAFGLLAGAVSAAALAASRSRQRGAAPCAAWALVLPGALCFYWVYSANLMYGGDSRDPVAFALDGLAVVAALVLAAVLWRLVVARGGGRRTRLRWTVALILVSWVPLYALSAEPAMERTRVSRRPQSEARVPEGAPNLLLIMLDTVRSDCLSCYGPTEFQTPGIDRLAAGSVLFEQAVTPEPLTRPAVCTMFTGLYPRTHGVDTNTKALGESFVTLAEAVRAEGYATGAFTAATVLSGTYGTAQGFDYYSEPSEPWWYLRSDFAARRLYISLTSWKNWWVEIRAGEVNRLAMDWLGRNADRPFLAFVHYFDAHAPYDPLPEHDLAAREGLGSIPPPYDDEQVRFSPGFDMPADFLRQEWLRYRGEIAHVDDSVGELLGFLDDSNLSEKTIVALVADHGESFEHSAYFSHGTRLYDPQVHVAFMIRDPRLPGASRVRGQVRLVDLFPTLLSLLDIEPTVPVQGIDLSPRMRGQEGDADLPAFCQTDLEDDRPLSSRASHAVRMPPWKYIESPEIGLVELYDLSADPGETTDVARSRVEALEELAGALRDWMDSTERLEIEPAQIDPQALEELRALGYLE